MKKKKPEFFWASKSDTWASILIQGKVVDVVHIDLPSEDGEGASFEFSMKWKRIGVGPHEAICPEISLFADEWQAFSLIPELFAWLAKNPRRFTPEEFVKKLKKLGYTDGTKKD